MNSGVETPLRLNIGAGDKVVEGWTSLGLQDTHAIKSDVRALPLADDSVDEAMAIHVLEHLHRWEAPAALAEWRRVLKPGARLSLELPELKRCCTAVLEGFKEHNGLYGLFGDPIYEDPLMTHKWCYSEDELMRELKNAGFRKIQIAPLQTHGRKRWRDMRVECIK